MHGGLSEPGKRDRNFHIVFIILYYRSVVRQEGSDYFRTR